MVGLTTMIEYVKVNAGRRNKFIVKFQLHKCQISITHRYEK
jgi:hypothetical protein